MSRNHSYGFLRSRRMLSALQPGVARGWSCLGSIEEGKTPPGAYSYTARTGVAMAELVASKISRGLTNPNEGAMMV